MKTTRIRNEEELYEGNGHGIIKYITINTGTIKVNVMKGFSKAGGS